MPKKLHRYSLTAFTGFYLVLVIGELVSSPLSPDELLEGQKNILVIETPRILGTHSAQSGCSVSVLYFVFPQMGKNAENSLLTVEEGQRGEHTK